jgi:hypothetical protein
MDFVSSSPLFSTTTPFFIIIIIHFSSFDNISRRHTSWIIRVFCVHSFSTDIVYWKISSSSYNYSNVSQLKRKIPRVPEKHFIYAALSQFSPWRVLIITDTIASPVINLATFWIYVTHDNKLCIKSKKFTSIFNNKLNKRCFLLSTGLINLEGPFYESHYLYESTNTDAKFKHLRSRMSVEMILSTKYYK